jgi:hypothetical protein
VWSTPTIVPHFANDPNPTVWVSTGNAGNGDPMYGNSSTCGSNQLTGLNNKTVQSCIYPQTNPYQNSIEPYAQLNIDPLAAVGEAQWLVLVDPKTLTVTYYQDPNYNNANGAPMYVSGAALSACALFIADEIAPAGATTSSGYLYSYVPPAADCPP